MPLEKVIADTAILHPKFEAMIALNFRPVICSINIGFTTDPRVGTAGSHNRAGEASNVDGNKSTRKCIDVYARNAQGGRSRRPIIRRKVHVH